MTKRSDPWFKFFPADWRAEPSLRAVSIAARGLWVEMLCLMHEAEPRGHLLLNGRPMTDAQLGALAGVPANTARDLLGELEAAGTFSRTRAGVIYSRRMRADTALSAKQRANVEKRWQKPRDGGVSQGSENKEETGIGNTKPDTNSIPKKPEARSQKKDTVRKPLADELFEVAWEACTKQMRTRSKARSLTLPFWHEASRQAGSPERLLGALYAYLKTDPDVGRTGGPGFHLWLRDGKWEAHLAARKAQEAVAADPQARALREQHWRETGEWRDSWGPMPEAVAA